MASSILDKEPPAADKRLAYGNDPNQFGDLRLPRGKGPHPLIVNIHGGFWRAAYDLTHAGHLCAALAGEGYATWNLEYRRVGNLGGGWPGSLEDISLGYRFLRQEAKAFNLDISKTMVMGHSAGGQLALCLASHEPTVHSVVALAAVSDLKNAWVRHLSNDAVVEFLGGRPGEVPEHYKEADPLEFAVKSAVQWLVHGLDDDIVPFEYSRNYVQQKRKDKEDVHLLEIAGASHFDVIDPHSAAWKKIAVTIASLLPAQ